MPLDWMHSSDSGKLKYMKRGKKGARKSDYIISNYLGALVGDFIRGKKLQVEGRERREQNESKEIMASLASQRTNVTLPMSHCNTKACSWKQRSNGREKQNNKDQHAFFTRLEAAWCQDCNHLFDAIVKKGQACVLVADEGALLDEADEYLGLGELGVELLVGTVSAFEEPCRKGRRECGVSFTVISVYGIYEFSVTR